MKGYEASGCAYNGAGKGPIPGAPDAADVVGLKAFICVHLRHLRIGPTPIDPQMTQM
jgi:hypothetical protein